MKNIRFILLTISLFACCNNPQNNSAEKNDRLELVPEPDKAVRLKYEAIQQLKKSGCILSEPDTSLCGIKIRNAESTIAIIGKKDKVDSLNQYNFYSTFDRETMTLTQHPGDGEYQISIFNIRYSDKADHGYRQLNIDTFKTEKGIKLGMNKKQIIDRLGICYAAIDSTKDYIELYYIIEIPNDSKTQILKTNNMPMYYAAYKLWNDKLESFEFGFENP